MSASDAAAEDAGAARADAGDDAAVAPTTAPAELPAVTGECPGFADGDGCTEDGGSLICIFTPAGLEPRPVRIWMSDAARDQHGPLVFFWHGLSRTASDAVLGLAGLGPDVLQEIVAAGGIVAAPERSEKREMPALGTLPWLLALGSGEEDDLLVMDDVTACADQVIGIDPARIHVTGMSAGGLQTGQVAARRSSYVASIAVFSGGQLGTPPIEDPDNRYAAILFHGGMDDEVALNFEQTQTQFHDRLQEQNQFVLICDHGQGHTVPTAAAIAAWEFLKDHPRGIDPEPYADALPDTVPAYCER